VTELGPRPDTDVLTVRHTRALLAPAVPALALAAAALLHLSAGAVVLLLLALLVVLGLALMAVLAPGVEVRGDRLDAGPPPRDGRGPGGSVDLTCLTRARSVSYHGGLVSGRGLAVFRNQLLLEDAEGGRAMTGAWGWTPKAPLQAALRTAVSEGHARMDPLTFRRLGFSNVQGARIGRRRRVL
jgi:hypothetical protein